MTWPLGPLLQRVSWLFLGQAKLEETMGLPAKVSVLVPELIGNDLAALAWSLAKLETAPEAARVNFGSFSIICGTAVGRTRALRP